MVGTKDPKIRGARKWLGTLLVAWTFVSSSALLLATAYYQRSGDLRVLIVWLAPPFVIGCVIFAMIALASVAGQTKEKRVDVVNHTGTRQSIFKGR